ncbi:MAG: MaoC/PaaZ C-terminal domain-containing protein [Planctomycetota bacterium]
MSEQWFFENVAVGDQWRSLGRTITETDVVNFAGVTGDYDPLHVDHEYARHAPFGKPIAHGLLGLSLLAGLSSQSPCMKTAAFIRIHNWEFHKPIYIGDTVYAETEVTDKQLEGRRTGRVTWHRRLLNQRGEVLQSGVLETLVFVKNVKRKPRNAKPSPPSDPASERTREPEED